MYKTLTIWYNAQFNEPCTSSYNVRPLWLLQYKLSLRSVSSTQKNILLITFVSLTKSFCYLHRAHAVIPPHSVKIQKPWHRNQPRKMKFRKIRVELEIRGDDLQCNDAFIPILQHPDGLAQNFSSSIVYWYIKALHWAIRLI